MRVGRALEVGNHSVLISEKAPGFIAYEKIRSTIEKKSESTVARVE